MPLGILWTPTYGGGGAPPPPPEDDITISDGNDDGTQEIGTSIWENTVGWCFLFDIDGNGNGRDSGDYIAAFSFPGVTLTSCSTATLYLEVQAFDFSSARVFGERSVASAPWSNSNLPSSKFGALETTNSSAFGLFITAVIAIPVTDIIQEIMALPGWAGGRINLWAQGNSANAYGEFVHVGTVGSQPRLHIIG